MLNVISVIALLLLAGLFFFLAVRAGRARRAWIRWPGLLFAGLLGLLFLVISGVAGYGLYKLSYPPYTYSVVDLKVAGTPEQLVRGEHLAQICVDCHSSTGALPLDGSKDNFVAGGPPVGVLYGPNLTPGGRLKDWSDGEIMRALREGISKNGSPLIVMPSEPFHHLSDEDAQSIIAYLRSQPAVNRDLPERDLNILAALLVGTGMFPTSAQEPITAPVVAPAAGTLDYGKYLVYSSGCRDCHGPNLTGMSGGNGPGGPNLTASMPAWNEEQFLAFFRSGVNKDGRPVDLMAMPWKSYGLAFSDAELRDMYNYLHGLPMVKTAP